MRGIMPTLTLVQSYSTRMGNLGIKHKTRQAHEIQSDQFLAQSSSSLVTCWRSSPGADSRQPCTGLQFLKRRRRGNPARSWHSSCCQTVVFCWIPSLDLTSQYHSIRMKEGKDWKPQWGITGNSGYTVQYTEYSTIEYNFSQGEKFCIVVHTFLGEGGNPLGFGPNPYFDTFLTLP